MNCSWCGSWPARETVTHDTLAGPRCGARSPYDPRLTCARARNHDGPCKAAGPQVPTFLCTTCFGIWRETGERPPAYRLRDPDRGPLPGRTFDPRRIS